MGKVVVNGYLFLAAICWNAKDAMVLAKYPCQRSAGLSCQWRRIRKET